MERAKRANNWASKRSNATYHGEPNQLTDFEIGMQAAEIEGNVGKEGRKSSKWKENRNVGEIDSEEKEWGK